MCTLFWLIDKYIFQNNGLRDFEILLMIYFDFLYYLAFRVIRKIGKEADEDNET